MDIGTEKKAIIVEPLSDPFKRDTPPAPAPAPTPEPVKEPTPA